MQEKKEPYVIAFWKIWSYNIFFSVINLEQHVLHWVKPKHTDAQRLKRRVFHKAKALQLG